MNARAWADGYGLWRARKEAAHCRVADDSGVHLPSPGFDVPALYCKEGARGRWTSAALTCPRCIQYEPSYRKLLERLRIEEPS